MKYLLAILPLAVGCAPIVPPDVPADCGTPAQCACANLCKLECPGECQPECEAKIEQVLLERLTPFDPECVAAAKTKAEVRLCPAIVCE